MMTPPNTFPSAYQGKFRVLLQTGDQDERNRDWYFPASMSAHHMRAMIPPSRLEKPLGLHTCNGFTNKQAILAYLPGVISVMQVSPLRTHPASTLYIWLGVTVPRTFESQDPETLWHAFAGTWIKLSNRATWVNCGPIIWSRPNRQGWTLIRRN